MKIISHVLIVAQLFLKLKCQDVQPIKGQENNNLIKEPNNIDSLIKICLAIAGLLIVLIEGIVWLRERKRRTTVVFTDFTKDL